MFSERITQAAATLRALREPISLIGHLDTDGLCATAILSTVLERLQKEHTITILPQLSEIFLKNLTGESFIFVDGGSGHLESIEKIKRPVMIIDHHRIDGDIKEGFVLNPVLDGHDGGREACSASVAYLLAKELECAQGLAHLAIIGIIGDAQEKGGMVGFNAQVLEDALAENLIATIRTPRFFGVFSKPIAKLLASSHDLNLVGITGNFGGAKDFLKSLGIRDRDAQGTLRTYCDLSSQEQELLISSIAKKGSRDIIEQYRVCGIDGVLCDARIYATFLNACGRLDEVDVGIAAAKGVQEAIDEAPHILRTYRQKLRELVKWYRCEGDGLVTRTKNLVIIRGQGIVPPELAGTLCSIITRGSMVERGVVVLALARYRSGITKISARGSQHVYGAIQAASEAVEGEYGGHAAAAGALIPTAREDDFIKAFNIGLQR